MSEGAPRPIPSFDKTTRLVARALRMDVSALQAAMRPATPDDLADVLALRAEVIGQELRGDDRAYLLWRYGLGQAQARHGQGELWVLRREAVLLAIIGVERLHVRVHDHDSQLHRGMDILIRPELRDAGLGLWLSQFMVHHYGNLLAVGANDRSAGLVARAFEQLPERRAYIRPIRMNHVLGRALGQGQLAGVVARCANLALRVYGRLTLWPGREGLRVQRIKEVPADVQALLSRSMNPRRLEFMRSAPYWAWRMASPLATFDLWEARDPKDQALRGLMVTRLAEPEPGRKVCTVMDLVMDESMKQAALRALLKSALEHAQASHAEFLLWIGCRQDVEPEFVRAGFVRRPGGSLAMSWQCADSQLRAVAATQPDWTFNELHMDSD